MKWKLVDYDSSSDEEGSKEMKEIPLRKYHRIEEILEWSNKEREMLFKKRPRTQFKYKNGKNGSISKNGNWKNVLSVQIVLSLYLNMSSDSDGLE